jgi:hypothetical protein
MIILHHESLSLQRLNYQHNFVTNCLDDVHNGYKIFTFLKALVKNKYP